MLEDDRYFFGLVRVWVAFLSYFLLLAASDSDPWWIGLFNFESCKSIAVLQFFSMPPSTCTSHPPPQPLGEDWTPFFRESKVVQEYIMIGETVSSFHVTSTSATFVTM